MNEYSFFTGMHVKVKLFFKLMQEKVKEQYLRESGDDFIFPYYDWSVI